MNQEAQALADEIKRLANKAVKAHRPLFNAETPPNAFEKRDAERAMRALRKTIDRLAAMVQPREGWVMVPVEPTHNMIEAGEAQTMVGAYIDMTRRQYRAMLSAAPKPEDTK